MILCFLITFGLIVFDERSYPGDCGEEKDADEYKNKEYTEYYFDGAKQQVDDTNSEAIFIR